MQSILDETVYQFEAAHQAGENPQVADFLTAETDTGLLLELIHVDLEYRLKRGEQVVVEHYVQRFPQIADRQSDLVELILAEWDLRSRSERLELNAVLERFPEQADAIRGRIKPVPASGSVVLRCPDCRTRLPLTTDSELAGISCSSCGSEVRLAAEALSPGQTLAQFELLELVGTGAFGSVWRARDTELGRTVAIKVPRHKLDGPDADQFFREARATAGLRHPNIVTTYEVGRDGQHVYIASDFIEGRTLATVLETKRIAPAEVVRLCVAICGALECAHAAGVVHRDLKPSNIMIDPHGNPIVMDFGLAKRATGEVTMTIDGRILGTPAFMSPEQAAGEAHSADQRSDIYSLGVILFALLTNELPFRGGIQMVLQQVRHADPPSPRSLEPRLPRDLETICLKCLEKQPANRFATVGELADELRRFSSGEPIRSRPISHQERLSRWARRKPVLAMLYGLLATIAVAAPIVAFNQARLRWAAEDSERKLGHAVRDLEAENTRAVAAETETAELNSELSAALRESRTQFTRARTAVYAATLQSVRSEFEAGNFGRAISLLDRCSPALRNWEWGYVRALCERGCTRVPLPQVRGVLFMQQGRRLVENHGRFVVIRDSQARQLRKLEFTELSRPNVVAIAACERENLVICLDHNGLITQWNTESGQRVRFFHIEGIEVDSRSFSFHGHGLAVHPKEPTIAVSAGKSGKILLVNLLDGSPVETGNRVMKSWYQRDDAAYRLQYSPRGSWLMAFGERGLTVHQPHVRYDSRRFARLPLGQSAVGFNPVNGQMFHEWQLCRLDENNRSGRPEPLLELQQEGPAITPEERHKLAAEASLQGKSYVRYLPAFGQVSSVGFSPGGNYFATAMHRGELLIWDCSDGSVVLRLAVPDRIHSVQWTDDSTVLVRSRRALTTWNVQALIQGVTGAPLRSPRSISVEHDGMIAEAVGLREQTLQVRRAAGVEPVLLAHPRINTFSSLSFTADGKYLVAAPGYKQPAEVSVYDTTTADLVRTIDLKPLAISPGRRVVGVPGSSHVAVANESEVFVLDAVTGTVARSWPIPMAPGRPGQPLRITKLVPSTDGAKLCLQIAYRGLLICDIRTGDKLAEFETDNAWDVAWSQNSTLAVGVRNHLELRDENLQLIRSLPADFERRVLSVCFSADGQRLYAVGEGRIIRGYDVEAGVNVLTEAIVPDPILLPMTDLRWHGTTLVGTSGAYNYRLPAAAYPHD